MTQEDYNKLSTEEKIELSNNDNTSKDVLDMLINDKDDNVKLQLLMNSKGAKDMFASFAK